MNRNRLKGVKGPAESLLSIRVLFQVLLTYPNVCSRMRTYAHVCSRMEAKLSSLCLYPLQGAAHAGAAVLTLLELGAVTTAAALGTLLRCSP
jgi:hypothetical protein